MSRFGKQVGIADICMAEPVSIACTVRARLRGLLGRSAEQGILVLVPCHSIHTFGMRFPIDVAFVSADGSVLEVHRNVGVRKRLHCRHAVATFEREATEGAPWFSVGQRIWVSGASLWEARFGGTRLQEACSKGTHMNNEEGVSI